MKLGAITPVKYMLGSAAVQRIYLGANQVWSAASYDPDAAAYIAAVEAADGAELEADVKLAFDAFVVGCKADGIWTPLKASCIMAGARSLAGALVPLVGPAPTNNNFVAGDYDRKTGLVGNGSNKYLDTNRNNTDDPQNNKHQGLWVSEPQTNTTFRFYIGNNQSGPDQIITSDPATATRSLISGRGADRAGGNVAGFMGITRTSSTACQTRTGGSTVNGTTLASQTPASGNIWVFGGNNGSLLNPTNARLAFYSDGEALNLSLLDARLTTLMSDLDAAIP
jgi:hypothetical protein